MIEYRTHPEWMSEEALHTVSKSYLLPGETVRGAFQRISGTAQKFLTEIDGIDEEIFECLWRGWLGAASPVFSNFGTNRGLPISCLVSGTKIHTKEGYKKIEDLKVGDEVLTHLGRYRKILNIWNRESQDDLYKLIVNKRKKYPLYITGNHPVLTNKGWVKVDDLNNKEHKIVIEPLTSAFRQIDNYKTFEFKVGSERYNKNTSYKIKNTGSFKCKEIPNVSLNEDLAWFFGLWFAEGSTSDNGAIKITMHPNEEPLVKKWLSIAKTYFNLEGKIRLEECEDRGSSWLEGAIYNKYLQQWFDTNFGKGCKNIIIPEWILNLRDSALQVFFDAFVLGDGSKDKDKGTKIVLANEKLVYQLWHIATILGLNPSLLKGKSTTGFDNYGIYLPKFPYKNPLSPKFELTKLKENELVWDIEVEEDHSFIAQGVVVHNCYSIDVSDSIPSIFSHLKEAAMLSKNGGGVGVNLNRIRHAGSLISGGGTTSGIAPVARLFDKTFGYVNQGGVFS